MPRGHYVVPTVELTDSFASDLKILLFALAAYMRLKPEQRKYLNRRTKDKTLVSLSDDEVRALQHRMYTRVTRAHKRSVIDNVRNTQYNQPSKSSGR